MKIEDLAISMADDYMRARTAIINSGDTLAGPALDAVVLEAVKIKHDRAYNDGIDDGQRLLYAECRTGTMSSLEPAVKELALDNERLIAAIQESRRNRLDNTA